MKIYTWPHVPQSFFQKESAESVRETVQEIIRTVRERGDEALQEYTARFDGIDQPVRVIDRKELNFFVEKLTEEEKNAVEQLIRHVTFFARKQRESIGEFQTEPVPELLLGQRIIPLEKVGIYVPGGNFPLVSTVAMCAVPAREAGVSQIVMATPPGRDGNIHPAVAAAAAMAGVDKAVLVGGAQAIAALAYGTETVPAVDKIVGPGNAWVAEAKRQVYGRVGIDFIAGPSEVMVIADKSANAEFVAADLLAQAEHDVNAVSVLVTPDRELAERVLVELERQLSQLSTGDIARRSLEMNGAVILVNDLAEAVEVANQKAPEHLEVQVANPDDLIPQLKNYGSLFIGDYAAEVLGDYSAGVNHTLPTAGAARYTGGLSVFDFLKVTTFIRSTKKGFMAIADSARKLGEMEGLEAHAHAVKVRLNNERK